MAQTEEVKLHFLDYWRVIRVRWVLILLAFFLVLITAAVVTYFQPREYQSSVFIEVRSTAENPRIFDSVIRISPSTIRSWRPPFSRSFSAPAFFTRSSKI